MKPKFSDLQRAYDNLTPETIGNVSRKRSHRTEPDDDYEDESYYKSKAFSRVMDVYERRIYGD